MSHLNLLSCLSATEKSGDDPVFDYLGHFCFLEEERVAKRSNRQPLSKAAMGTTSFDQPQLLRSFSINIRDLLAPPSS